MPSRLLAFALALIIGSPTCWCCLPRESASSKATARRSCCHGSGGHAGTPAKHQECPCTLSLTKRDLADGKVLPPKPLAGGAMQELPHVHALPSAPMVVRVQAPSVDEDPPWRLQKTYERNCSRLL